MLAGMAKAPRDRWRNEPTSTAVQPDSVPSKALPPRSSMERMGNGERFGFCPTCGHDNWWDNLARKRAGQLARDKPDYLCADCGHARWLDGRERPGRPWSWQKSRPAAVELDPLPAPRSTGAMCAGTKTDGAKCANRAMPGQRFCGPHSAVPLANQCRGVTKAGKPCRAGAERGSDYCPQHRPG